MQSASEDSPLEISNGITIGGTTKNALTLTVNKAVLFHGFACLVAPTTFST